VSPSPGEPHAIAQRGLRHEIGSRPLASKGRLSRQKPRGPWRRVGEGFPRGFCPLGLAAPAIVLCELRDGAGSLLWRDPPFRGRGIAAASPGGTWAIDPVRGAARPVCTRPIARHTDTWRCDTCEALPVVGLGAAACEGRPRVRGSAEPRSHEIDALRAAALLGVVVVNYTTVFRTPVLKYIAVFHTRPETIHRVTDLVVGVAVESKAFAIYAMLFGAGMASWAERGRPLTMRLTVLLCLGAMHMLLWNGDILLLYGLLGLALAPLTVAKPRTLLLLGTLFLCIAATPGLVPDLLPTGYEREQWVWRAEQAYTSSDLRALLTFRLAETYHVIAPLLIGVTARTLACMLTGMAAWKSGVLRNPSSNRTLFVRIAVIAMAVGIVATGLELADIYGVIRAKALDHTCHEIGIVGLAIGYGSGALASFSASSGSVTVWLSQLGRVSLTCYITQSIIGGALFYGYGLKLFGRLGSATAVGIAVAVYVVQGFMAPLLLRSGQGPLEKLWRYASMR
jgi:uncharacterized protein